MHYSVYRKLLLMVSELHVRGFQRIRIAPGMSPSGCHWRCSIAPVTNISSRHGAQISSWDKLAAHYTSGQGSNYFDWIDAEHVAPSQLAELFIERFPRIVEAGRGPDWVYSGWYLEMLHLTYPDSFPIAYADWDLPKDHLATTGARCDIRIPLPPPGWGPEEERLE
jgi:hypothetical protein